MVMPEPDFEQLALDVGIRAGRDDILPYIAAALRQVWNARGAADREAINGELTPQYQVVTATAIAKVDR